MPALLVNNKGFTSDTRGGQKWSNTMVGGRLVRRAPQHEKSYWTHYDSGKKEPVFHIQETKDQHKELH
eukprot:773650-Ditylum_brightwellii.AAC.1